MAIQRNLTDEERLRLERWVRVAAEAAGVRRCHSILRKEARLVPGTGNTPLKKTLPDPKRIATHIVSSLQDSPMQHRACVAMKRIVRAAWKSAQVDEQAEQLLIQASAAFRDRKADRLDRLCARLDERAEEESDNVLLVDHRCFIRLESESPEHVYSALDIDLVRDVYVNQTTMPAQAPEAESATSVIASVNVDVSREGRPHGRETHVMATGANVMERGPARAGGAGPKPAAEPLPDSESADAALKPIDKLFDELAKVAAAAEAPDPDVAAFAALFDDCVATIEARYGAAASPPEQVSLLAELADGAKRAQAVIEAAMGEAAAKREQARQGLADVLGNADMPTSAAQWQRLRNEISELGEEATAGCAPAWAETEGQPLERRLAELEAWCRSHSQAAADAREEAALLTRLAEIQKRRSGGHAAVSLALPGAAVQETGGSNRAAEGAIEVTGDASPPSHLTHRSLHFDSARAFPASFPSMDLLVRAAEARSDDPRAVFLPLGPPGASLADRGQSDGQRLTAAAAFLLDVLRHEVQEGSVHVTYLCGVLADVSALAGPEDADPGNALRVASLGLLLVAGSELRARRGGPYLRNLLDADNSVDAFLSLAKLADLTARAPAVPLVMGAALRTGLAPLLQILLDMVAQHSRLNAVRLGEALAIALATSSDRQDFVTSMLRRAKVEDSTIDQVDAFLQAARASKYRQASRLPVGLRPWMAALVDRLERCLFESDDRASPTLNISVPQSVQKHGIYIEEGAASVRLPALVLNNGKGAASGVELRFAAKDGIEVPARERQHYVPWLARTGIEANNDALIEVTVNLADDAPDNITVSCTWQTTGSRESQHRTLRYKRATETPSSTARRMPGVDGEPMDLTAPGVLQRSSKTVQAVFEELRIALVEGKPTRKLVYGRRRRGKSSIRNTLERDSRIGTQFSVVSSVWNAARMTSASTALVELSRLLVRALGQRGFEVTSFAFEPHADRDALSLGWTQWLASLGDVVTKQTKVLLLIDEFHKWLAALDRPEDRQQVLNAFRSFNDKACGPKIDVSFVLFGLRSLKRLCADSNDFSNAVTMHEIRHLNIEEGSRYVLGTLPVDHDRRTRDRLSRLSGGNPFVLNLLCAELARTVAEAQRAYAIGSDVDAILANMDGLDSRIDSFFTYMLKEDEDESASTLTQLTVLQAIASILNDDGDFQRLVSASEVEEWLGTRSVPHDPGLPQLHLEQLVDVGILDKHGDGQRFGLAGEAMCRWLAARCKGSTPLQSVQRIADVDLVLNRYRREEHLGTGGQGSTIWLATDTNVSGRRVALKIYPGGHLDLRPRVEREARLLERARGRYVVQFYDKGFDEARGGVIVMEWIQGQTLRAALDDPPNALQPLLAGGEPSRQVEFMKRLTEGVMCIHRAGVVHKDLSARNVMLVEQNSVFEPRLIDFGISGEVNADAETLAEGTIALGTPRYTAPEKRLEGSPRSRQADIYSLGVIFVDLIAERRADADPLDQLEGATAPPHLKALVGAMLSAEPAERPSAEEVAARLQNALVPVKWTDLRDEAERRFSENEYIEALAAFRAAIAETPAIDRRTDAFGELLRDCLDCVGESPGEMDWWESYLSTLLKYSTAARTPLDLTSLIEHVAASAEHTTEGRGLFAMLMCQIERLEPAEALAGLVRQLATMTQLPESCFVKLHALLVAYCASDLITGAEAADFCVVRSRTLRTSARPLTHSELWLRRGQRLCPGDHAALESERHEVARAREKTGIIVTLPAVCDSIDATLGAKEAGHDDQDRILAFARRAHCAYPFLPVIRRLRKEPRMRTSSPTLLPVDNGSTELRGIPAARIIPFLLDPSYTRGGHRDAVSLRMAFVLAEGTTAAQRDAAYELLRADNELFPG